MKLPKPLWLAVTVPPVALLCLLGALCELLGLEAWSEGLKTWVDEIMECA